MEEEARAGDSLQRPAIVAGEQERLGKKVNSFITCFTRLGIHSRRC